MRWNPEAVRWVGAAVLLIAVALAPAAAQQTVIHAGRLVDVAQGTVNSNVDILIRGNLIEKVGSRLHVPDGAREIDLRDRTVLPGLIDSHQHIMLSKDTGPQDILNNQLVYTPAYNAIPQGKIMLMMGVTTIRDTGGPSVELGQATDKGYVDGPRIYSAGAAVSCTSGHGDFGGQAPGQGQRYPGSTANWASTGR